MMMIKNKKRKVVTSSLSTTTTTTIDSLPDDVVEDILLRLPSAAAIYRAVLATATFLRVAATGTFLRRLRAVHDDNPLLLGHIVGPDGQGSTPPHFVPAPLQHQSSESDGVLAAMVRRGDFFLTRVLQSQAAAGSGGRTVLEDCRGGLLLFSDAGSLRVFDPMTHRVSSVDPLPRRGGRAPDHRGRRLCLLPPNSDGGPGAFRVMSMRHGNKKKPARLEVYSSCTRAWCIIPEFGIPDRCKMAMIYRRQHSPAMHAGDRVFWNYDGQDSLLSLDTKTMTRVFWNYDGQDSLLSLDTKTMTFSDVHLPPGVTRGSAYAVGETEDSTCCLVGVGRSASSRLMQVWRFVNGAQMWALERQVPLILDSPSAGFTVYQVRAVVGGIVLMCFNNSLTYQHHIAFRLKSLKVEADFMCRGLAHPFVIE